MRGGSETILQWGAICGGLTAIAFFLRVVYRTIGRIVKTATTAVHRIEKMNDLIDYELQPNGGGSNKESIRHTQDAINDLNGRFDMHLAANARDTAAMWSAIEAIAKSSPPEEPTGDEQ